MKTILVIDDERDIRESLDGVLGDEGYSVMTAKSCEEGMTFVEESSPDLILLDIWMPGMDGVELLGKVKERFESIPVIMISGHATIETAVKTTKLGAYDFIEKPLSLDKVILTVEHALEQSRLVEENMALRASFVEDYTLIGKSKPMRLLKEEINRVAPTNSWVLITGENGTGKEFVARNVHLLSDRVDKPFVEVNSAAIPEELIESELFGHVKGAFTNAHANKKGKFDMADSGTIFLDEIGDMSLKTQAKILRILQEQSFERVGGTETIKVDVRVIAATNKDLSEEIKKGAFREDLYYRLNVIPFHVSPLRERREDISLFVEHFFDLFSRKAARERPTVSEEALSKLAAYSWPGNVRELKNLVERLVIMVSSNTITPDDLPDYIVGESEAVEARQGVVADELRIPSFKDARNAFEKRYLSAKLKEHEGNVSKTAEAVGLERSHLYRKIKGYGIEN